MSEGSVYATITQQCTIAVSGPAEPTRTGYTFAGWSESVPATMPAENKTLTAQWNANVYSITLNTNEGTIDSGNVTSYTYGVGAVLPTDISRLGYNFNGWFDNEECEGDAIAAISTTDIGDKTYYAKWKYKFPAVIPTYNVVIDGNVLGGKLSANKSTSRGSETIVITVETAEGFKLEALTVTDAAGNAITVAKVNVRYVFNMPESDVIVSAKFTSTASECTGSSACPMHPYTDLKSDLWYHDGIHFCIENGLMNGISDNDFAPNATTNRAMLITVLWRLAGSPVVDASISFDDVAEGKWYTEAIRWAASNKIVEGYGNGKFGVSDNVTREQVATIMYRYEQYKGGGFVGSWIFYLDYADTDKISAWAYESMCWMSMNGVINGKPGKILDPKGTATRAEVAAMIYRYTLIVR